MSKIFKTLIFKHFHQFTFNPLSYPAKVGCFTLHHPPGGRPGFE